MPSAQGQAFPNPFSTNHIVLALYIRAQRHPWVVKNRVLTIGAICGKACALAQMAVESSLYQVEVHEVSSISSDIQLLLRHKLQLGAMPCSASGTGSPRGFRPQANSPRPSLGANLRKINKYREKTTQKKNYKFWIEPRPCMVLGLKPMGKPSTQKNKLQVLDRTKALYGPRTQAYGETKYSKE